MLFPKRTWAGVADGSITVAFRRWTRPTVRTGGTLRSPAGRLAIDEVAVIDRAAVTDADARRAGAADRHEVLAALDQRTDGQVHRVRFHVLDEPDPRDQLAAGADLSDDDLADLRARLARQVLSVASGEHQGRRCARVTRRGSRGRPGLSASGSQRREVRCSGGRMPAESGRPHLRDRRDQRAPWTRAILRLVGDHPDVAARELADLLGWERADLKRDVRKLKALGLTTSQRVGYRLSPRGRAFLDAEDRPEADAPDGNTRSR